MSHGQIIWTCTGSTLYCYRYKPCTCESLGAYYSNPDSCQGNTVAIRVGYLGCAYKDTSIVTATECYKCGNGCAVTIVNNDCDTDENPAGVFGGGFDPYVVTVTCNNGTYVYTIPNQCNTWVHLLPNEDCATCSYHITGGDHDFIGNGGSVTFSKL